SSVQRSTTLVFVARPDIVKNVKSSLQEKKRISNYRGFVSAQPPIIITSFGKRILSLNYNVTPVTICILNRTFRFLWKKDMIYRKRNIILRFGNFYTLIP